MLDSQDAVLIGLAVREWITVVGGQAHFVGSRVKIQRSNRHIQELEAILDAFLQTDFCRVVVKDHPQSGGNIIGAEVTHGVPAETVAIIGDAIHNIRTAFDYVVSQMVPEHSRWISFPVGETREDLVATKSFGAVKKASPDFASLIADVIKPYRGGDFQIWEIAELDNVDKHRLLIPVLQLTTISGVHAIDKYENRVCNLTIALDRTGTSNDVMLRQGAKITSHGKATADIFFGPDVPFEHEPIIPALSYLVQIALRAVETLEAFHFGQRPSAT